MAFGSQGPRISSEATLNDLISLYATFAKSSPVRVRAKVERCLLLLNAPMLHMMMAVGKSFHISFRDGA